MAKQKSWVTSFDLADYKMTKPLRFLLEEFDAMRSFSTKPLTVVRLKNEDWHNMNDRILRQSDNARSLECVLYKGCRILTKSKAAA